MPDPAPPTSGMLSWTRGGEVLGGVTMLHGAAAAVGLALGLPALAGVGAAMAAVSLVAWMAHQRHSRIPVDGIGIFGVVALGLTGCIALGPDAGAQAFLLVLPALALVDQEQPWGSRLTRMAVALGAYGAFVAIMADIPPLWALPAGELAILSELSRVAALAVVGSLAWAAARSQERRRLLAQRAADTDPLTGLLRRRPAFARARELRAQQASSEAPLSVAVVDVDGMQAATLLGGQDAADTLLQQTATRLEACLRAGDLIGRLGPAEFLLVLPGVDSRRAWDVIDRLHGATRRSIPLADGRQLSGQVRVGLVVWESDEVIEECIARADAAVYRDRAEGLRELAS